MREVDRLEVIREVLGKRLGQREAGERLGICVRQVKRLVRRYRERGVRGLRWAAGETGEQWDSAGVEAGEWGWCGSATRTLHRPWRGRS